MNRTLFIAVISAVIFYCFGCKPKKQSKGEHYKTISVKEYQEAVYASWIGQIIGNTYGLGYEFTFIDEPGPDSFPYGYSWTIEDLKKHNGAYSDDDTDIEYMYLTQMEKHGIEPTYAQLAEAWKTHVKERVWCANRQAVSLMHAGHFPPVTGSVEFNHQWPQIDPQLINEIWAVTAPGMIDYAVEKSEYMAKITNDSFGIEPTLHYAAMYSAAFFEKNVLNLIDIGTANIGAASRFGKIVEHVKKLHKKYPEDWKTARQIIKENYMVYEDYNKYAWPVIDAHLNGAYGIMALLYGEGNFQKTLDYSCALGMDADNQAATMCGFLGIVYGLDSIPDELMFPVKDADWEKPFNDSYKMVTREGLDDVKITELAKRTAFQGEKIILAQGGEKFDQNGEEYFKINTNGRFRAPFELNPLPDFHIELNQPFTYKIHTGGNLGEIEILARGNVPPGIELVGLVLKGTPETEGTYSFEIVAKGNEELSVDVKVIVYSENIAPQAAEILFNGNAIDENVESIRDGNLKESYYSIKEGSLREEDNYGYIWDNEQTISAVQFNCGLPHEFGGWFTSMRIEYMDDGKWLEIQEPDIYPHMNLDNNQWLKPAFVNYTMSFPAVTTKGIRIVGMSGGVEKDAANAHLGMQFYTAISELKVFPGLEYE